MRKPNSLTIAQIETLRKTHGLFGNPTGHKKHLVKIRLDASKDPRRVAELKRYRDWLNRAIEWGEQ